MSFRQVVIVISHKLTTSASIYFCPGDNVQSIISSHSRPFVQRLIGLVGFPLDAEYNMHVKCKWESVPSIVQPVITPHKWPQHIVWKTLCDWLCFVSLLVPSCVLVAHIVDWWWWWWLVQGVRMNKHSVIMPLETGDFGQGFLTANGF